MPQARVVTVGHASVRRGRFMPDIRVERLAQVPLPTRSSRSRRLEQGSPLTEQWQTSLAGYKSPNDVALLTAEERESTPSFMYVWRRWVLTVLRDRCSSDAMST